MNPVIHYTVPADALDVTLTSAVAELSSLATAVLSTPSFLSYFLHSSLKSTALTVRLYKCVALVIEASIKALRGKRRSSSVATEPVAHFGGDGIAFTGVTVVIWCAVCV